MRMREIDEQSNDTGPRRGWILYDGQCGFCCRWVRLWKKAVERRGFGVKDLQSAYADGSLHLAPENLLDDILVLTPGGRCVPGADAYLFVARQIGWAWPFYAIFSLPGFHGLLWRGYRWLNRNRYRFSRHCSLPQEASAARLPKKRA
jgi:predicted DCC family thiol-disulfide oxidoreductase YuxK